MDFLRSDSLGDRTRVKRRNDRALQPWSEDDMPFPPTHHLCAVETPSPSPAEQAGCSLL